MGADPDISFDDDPFHFHVTPPFGIEIVVDGRQDTLMSDENVVPDGNAALVLEAAAGIDEDLLSEVDVSSEVRVEGREETESLIDFRADKP